MEFTARKRNIKWIILSSLTVHNNEQFALTQMFTGETNVEEVEYSFLGHPFLGK